MGSFRSCERGDLMNDRDVYERSEGYWDGEESCVCFVGLNGESGVEDCSEDSEWGLGES